MKKQHSGPAVVDAVDEYEFWFRLEGESFRWIPPTRLDGTKLTRHETAELFRAAADVLDDESVTVSEGG